jgi:ABC-2 type transport system permease protein
MTALALAAGRRTNPLAGAPALIRLDLRRAIRNRRYLVLTIGIPVVFYLLYTNVLGRGQDVNGSIGGTTWAAYFMVSMAAYGAMGAALATSRVVAGERTAGWTRQLRVIPLGPGAYLASKLVVSFVTTVPAILLVGLVGFAGNGVSLGAGTWVELLIALTIGSLPFAALGLLLGYVLDADGAQGGFTITYFTLAILGGLWMPVSSFPDALATIARVLPSYHFADLGWRAVAGLGPDPTDLLVLATYTVAIGALASRRFLADARRADG